VEGRKRNTMVHFPCVWYKHIGLERVVVWEVEREAERVKECIGGTLIVVRGGECER
jgi:hypothetical protein